MQKVLKGSEGRSLSPDSQTAHVDHVLWLRGTCTRNKYLKKKKKKALLTALCYNSGCALGLVWKVGERTGGAGVHHSGLRELVLQVEHCLAHLCRRSVLGFVAFVKNNL